MENVYNFMSKAVFVLKVFKYSFFSLSLSLSLFLSTIITENDRKHFEELELYEIISSIVSEGIMAI